MARQTSSVCSEFLPEKASVQNARVQQSVQIACVPVVSVKVEISGIDESKSDTWDVPPAQQKKQRKEPHFLGNKIAPLNYPPIFLKVSDLF